MTSDLSPCQIYISMQTVSGVGRWYKEDEGALSRRFVLEEIVDPSEDEWSKDDEATFGESKISVEIQAPRQEWLEEATHEGLPFYLRNLEGDGRLAARASHQLSGWIARSSRVCSSTIKRSSPGEAPRGCHRRNFESMGARIYPEFVAQAARSVP